MSTQMLKKVNRVFYGILQDCWERKIVLNREGIINLSEIDSKFLMIFVEMVLFDNLINQFCRTFHGLREESTH